MTASTFFNLLEIVGPHLVSTRLKLGCKEKTFKNGGSNGLISNEIRLSSAIRYFAGGKPEDISVVHGISHTEVYNSCWMVVDAVNHCAALAFAFPVCHEKQKELVLE